MAQTFSELMKFNAYHDRLGRFAEKGGFMNSGYSGDKKKQAVTFSAKPETRYGAKAIERESKAHEIIGVAYGSTPPTTAKPKESPKPTTVKQPRKPKVAKPKEPEDSKVIEFKPAASKKAATEYARDKLGIKEVSYGTKMNVETINSINETITNAYNKYPELRGSVDRIKTTSQRGVYAYAQTDATGKIQLAVSSISYGHGIEYLKQSYDRNVESGFHPKGTDYKSIVTHELGHVYEYTQAKKQSMRVAANQLDGYKYAVTLNRRENSNKWITQAANNLGTTKSKLQSAISKYATKNTSETFAEAFAEFNHSKNPSPECIAIMKAAGIFK